MFWLYIYICEQFSLFDTNTNVLTGLMISLFLAAPAPRVWRAWDLMGTSVRNGLRFFLLFGKKYFFIQKSSFLISNLFGNVFQTLRVTGLITLLYAKLRSKKYLNSWKNCFLVWQFIENQVFITSALFPCFSVFSLFKLIQFVCLVMEW